MFRSQLRLLLVHHHSAYRVFLHQFTSLELGVNTPRSQYLLDKLQLVSRTLPRSWTGFKIPVGFSTHPCEVASGIWSIHFLVLSFSRYLLAHWLVYQMSTFEKQLIRKEVN